MKRSDLDLEDILTDSVREDDLLEVPLAGRAFRVFLWLSFAVLAIVGAQLVNLGVLNHAWYAQRAAANITETQIQVAPRGAIEDRFGASLVRNVPSVNVFLVPKDLPRTAPERLAVLSSAVQALKLDLSVLSAEIQATDWRVQDRLLLATDVPQDELVDLSSLNLPGIQIESAFKRAHEVPLAFAQVLGYAGLVNANDLKVDPSLVPDDEVGRAGLEAYYDQYLRGTNGQAVAVHNAMGQVEEQRAASPSVPGATVKTFIDKDFQTYLYNRLQQALTELGRTVGAAVAIDPRNGEVLALVGIPSFQTDQIAESLTNPAQPFFNRIVSGLYNPGSTIKPLVAVGALTDGVITPTKQIFSPGYIDVPNPYDPANPTRFVEVHPAGWVDVYSALAKSSNVYFYEVGGGFGDQQGLGITRLKQWWQTFGLDQKTGIDLLGEQSGFLPDPAWKLAHTGQPWHIGDTYNVSIGQGDLSITPLELISYVSTIATGGKAYVPRIMESIVSAGGTTLTESHPTILRDITPEIGSEVANAQQGMRDVVAQPYGLAHSLSDLPFAVAAKTGTAQVNLNENTNAFFVGYAPYDNPQIALLILIENSKEGSLNTIPVAKDALLWYYEHRIQQSPNTTSTQS